MGFAAKPELFLAGFYRSLRTNIENTVSVGRGGQPPIQQRSIATHPISVADAEKPSASLVLNSRVPRIVALGKQIIVGSTTPRYHLGRSLELNAIQRPNQ